jgi:excisionase family DNA binding protein
MPAASHGQGSDPGVRPSLLPISETASILGVSSRHLYALAKAGTLPTVRVGTKLMVARAVVDGIIEAAARSGDWDPSRLAATRSGRAA